MTRTPKPNPPTSLARKKVRTHVKAGKGIGLGFFDAAHGGSGAA